MCSPLTLPHAFELSEIRERLPSTRAGFASAAVGLDKLWLSVEVHRSFERHSGTIWTMDVIQSIYPNLIAPEGHILSIR